MYTFKSAETRCCSALLSPLPSSSSASSPPTIPASTLSSQILFLFRKLVYRKYPIGIPQGHSAPFYQLLPATTSYHTAMSVVPKCDETGCTENAIRVNSRCRFCKLNFCWSHSENETSHPCLTASHPETNRDGFEFEKDPEVCDSKC